jgi:uncharacterized membrane protein
MRTRSVRTAVYLAGGIGLIVALFAAAEFYDAALRAVCSVSTFFSCSAVDNSGLTTTLWVPDWIWGVLGFVVILVAAALAEQRPNDRRYADALLGVTTVGVVLSLWLLYVELGEIHALCLVCASAYVLGGLCWVGAIELVRRTPEDDGDEDPDDDPEDDTDDDA